MSVLTRSFTAGVAALVLSAATVAAQPAPTPSARPAAASPPPGRHLIWRVAKAGRTVAFLVGSVHVLTKASYPLPPAFDAVYAQTKVLIEEVDIGESSDASAVLATASKAVFTDGQTLKTVLDAPIYARVSEKAEAAGLPMMILDRMKPWLVAMTLTVPDLQRAGFDPAQGLDRHFYERARADARPVRGLETAAYQIDRLNGLSMPVQVDMLHAMLDDVDTQIKSVGEIVEGWRSGDVPALERLLLREFQESTEVYQRLLVERNRNWAPAIAECRPAEPCMVVVGAAHLLGPDSVVVLLRKAGFTVEQM
jgi:uncharacterized protein YbaP (TraB family)